MQYDLFTTSQLSTDIEERKTIARLEHDEPRFDDLCIIQDEIDQLIELGETSSPRFHELVQISQSYDN